MSEVVAKEDSLMELPPLPEEVLCYIFSFIEDAKELGRLASVCKLWYKVSRKNSLWYKLMYSEFGLLLPKKRHWDCTWEMFAVLVQELRWVKENNSEGLDPNDPLWVSFDPSKQNASQFPSYIPNVGIWNSWGGCWYYEIHVEIGGVMQIGFATHQFGANCKIKNQLCGVGDDFASWSWDPWRLQAFHEWPKMVKDTNLHAKEFGTARSEDGSVVGVMIDLDRMEIRYFLNGEDLGVCFKDLTLKDRAFIFPAISIHARNQGLFSRGKTAGRFVLNKELMKFFPSAPACNTFECTESRLIRLKRREKEAFNSFQMLPSLQSLFKEEDE